MKTMRSLVVGCYVLSVTLLPSAFGNHRTGDFALPELIVAGDFNQDGKLDLAVNVAGFDNVAILTGDGLGGFTLKGHFPTDTLPKGLAGGDVNGDGHLDLVSIAQWGYNIKVRSGDGSGGFALANELNGDGEPTRILLNDLNHDGKLDLVANAPVEGKILVYFGDGIGGFSNPAVELEDVKNDYGIATGDFNNDGNLDIAATQFGDKTEKGSHCIIFLGDGVGGFTRGVEFGTQPEAGSFGIADVNKDGNVDIILAGAGAENSTGIFISTYLGDGTGNFSLKQTLDLGVGSIKGDIAIGDFNEDGKIDVAFPLSAGAVQHEFSTTVLTFFGDGTGNLTAGPSIEVGKEPHTVIAIDLNKDGHVDLAVTNRTDATLSVLLGNGTGGFTVHATIPVSVVPAP
jgi:hypothetical protein